MLGEETARSELLRVKDCGSAMEPDQEPLNDLSGCSWYRVASTRLQFSCSLEAHRPALRLIDQGVGALLQRRPGRVHITVAVRGARCH